MGGEIGQDWEWNHEGEIDWAALEHPLHRGVQRLVSDLNRLYRDEAALHQLDCVSAGFQWLMADDSSNSVYAYYRSGDANASPIIVACNFTPVPRLNYRIGAPRAGRWHEILNTDAERYGGSNLGNDGYVLAEAEPWQQQPASLALTLPPLSTVLLRHGD
jgi:1,4-alpha-glucan branching enzyme